jgi:hypothetical protein
VDSDDLDTPSRTSSLIARLRVTGGIDPYGELVSLRDWLAREDQLRRLVTVESPRIQPERMGTVADTLSIALGGGGVTTVLASSLSVWLKQRRADVTLEVHTVDGRTIKITAARVRDADAIIRQVLGQQQIRKGTPDAIAGRPEIKSDTDRE